MLPEWELDQDDSSSAKPELARVVSGQGLPQMAVCHLKSGAPCPTQACNTTLDTQQTIRSGPAALLCKHSGPQWLQARQMPASCLQPA